LEGRRLGKMAKRTTFLGKISLSRRRKRVYEGDWEPNAAVGAKHT